MFNKHMLQDMIQERLTEAAGEIFALFEQAVAEYQREIDRLKNGSEAKRVVVNFRGPQTSVKDARTAGGGSEGNAATFHCKEETEQVAIKREDEPRVLMITEVKSAADELQPHGQQHDANGEETETDNGSESRPESEEEDSRVGGDGLPFGSEKPFSCAVRRFPKIKMLNKKTPLGKMRGLTSAEANDRVESEHLISDTNNFGHPQPDDEAPDIARPFSCTVCDRRFKLRLTLEAHMRAHVGADPCSCTECGVTFKKQSYLINHIHRVHSAEKPLKCTICNRGFVHPNAFRTHMNSHTGERPFRCALCGKSFTQKGTLKRHMVTHSGEKPYNCSKCGKDYSTKQNLTNHMTKNH